MSLSQVVNVVTLIRKLHSHKSQPQLPSHVNDGDMMRDI